MGNKVLTMLVAGPLLSSTGGSSPTGLVSSHMQTSFFYGYLPEGTISSSGQLVGASQASQFIIAISLGSPPSRQSFTRLDGVSFKPEVNRALVFLRLTDNPLVDLLGYSWTQNYWYMGGIVRTAVQPTEPLLTDMV